MPRYVCKHRGKYFEWSSVVEAPVTIAMALNDFKVYYLEEYGRMGYTGLKWRLERVEKQGTSCQLGSTLEDFFELSVLNGFFRNRKQILKQLYP
ncbi:MAG: hypothetical protein ACUZ8H_01580 [Candidatus Anammoxibacter sp.]